MKIRRTQSPFRGARRISKRSVVISLVIVLLVAAVVYTLFSVRAWDSQDQLASTSRSELKSSIETLLITPGLATTEQPKETTADSTDESQQPFSTQQQIQIILSDYGAKIKGDDDCTLPAAFEWQSRLWFMVDRRQACEESNNAAKETITALENLYDTTESLQAAESSLATTLTATAAPTELTVAATQWSELATSINAREELPNIVRERIAATATALASAYAALQAANTAEDKAAFDTALGQINAQYEQLKTIQALANEARQPIVESVTQAYATL